MLVDYYYLYFLFFFFFKQKTAYEMRISDWSSDVCSSDLIHQEERPAEPGEPPGDQERRQAAADIRQGQGHDVRDEQIRGPAPEIAARASSRPNDRRAPDGRLNSLPQRNRRLVRPSSVGGFGEVGRRRP